MSARALAPALGLIEALRDPVALVDEEARLVAGNAALRALIPAARVGAPLVLSLRAPSVHAALAQALDGGRAQTVVWRERAPVERAFDVFVAPIADGASARVAISFRDVTDARRTERMRANFVADVSHELRTPLASVIGFIETLQGAAREDAAARSRFLTLMAAQAQRMKRLIDDLLSLARIEQTEHQRPDAPVDLAAVAAQVVDTLAPIAREKGMAMAVEAAETIVPGDRDELVRLVENLVENAIKYGSEAGPERRRVEVRVAREGSQAMLSVRDFGPGIAPEHAPRLTERFYRVDAGASRAKGGTGLGLAIVKHILARHRGRLAVESRLGEGATFRVWLPVKR